MSTKNNVLDAWIMVEHLTEGSIDKNDGTFLTFDAPKDGNYYDLFLKEINKKIEKNENLEKKSAPGIAIYLGVIPFSNVVEVLQKEFQVEKAEKKDQAYGNRYGVALYFDAELKLDIDMTFLTESYYIDQKKKVPQVAEFKQFEEENKKKIQALFEGSEGKDYKEFFNEAFKKALELYKTEVKDCRMKALTDIEFDDCGALSVLIADLEKAKTLENDILNDYLAGEKKERVDLDLKRDSEKFNGEAFFSIVQPLNAPFSRFPSDPDCVLSLMQQAAVNLAIGFDNQQIRSVNGPPESGKTTLLKDIFAELIVKQALEITQLKDKMLQGENSLNYFELARIGIVPEQIANKGIVVTGSSKSTVREIIHELPLLSGIGEDFKSELDKVDYFKAIANQKGVLCKLEGKEEKAAEGESEEAQCWGLFSMEGGKFQYMSNLITTMEAAFAYLDKSYKAGLTIYNEFMGMYDKMKEYRRRVQVQAMKFKEYKNLMRQIRQVEEEFEQRVQNKQNELEEKKKEIEKTNSDFNLRITNSDKRLEELAAKKAEAESEKSKLEKENEELQPAKIGLLTLGAARKELKDKNDEIQTKKTELQGKIEEAASKITNFEKQIEETELIKAKAQKDLAAGEGQAAQEQQYYDSWYEQEKSTLSQMKEDLEKMEPLVEEIKTKALDYDDDYETLQLSNPWFNQEYRMMQSKLFVLALKVRKQFLYENKSSVKAAIQIWNSREDYVSKPEVMREAWNWMNLIIPVIGTNLVGFNNMCANLGEKTFGCLFIVEAGQASPQVSVGAICRSRNVTVVGDSLNKKPVFSLDATVVDMLRKHFEIGEEYLSENASTQTMVEAISKYGYYRDEKRENWIGIPLWGYKGKDTIAIKGGEVSEN